VNTLSNTWGVTFIVHRLFIVTIHRSFIQTIHLYYSLLLFIDHPITPIFNYPSIMLSSLPKTSQTNIPVIWTRDCDFPSSENYPSGHPSQISPSWARLTLGFFRARLPNSYSNNSCFWILIELFPIQPCHPLCMVYILENSQNTLVLYSTCSD
jgi:hypothetical protein